MAKTLQQILGYENLTGIIQDPKGGIPATTLPPGFTNLRRPVEGNTAKWFAIEGNRKTARLVHYGSPSQARDMKGVTERTATMIHSFEHVIHDVPTLMMLQNFENPQVQQMGQQIVDQQTGQFRQGFNNLELAAIMKVLGAGTIYFDAGGNLLPTSSGALYTVDFQIPAGNKDQIGGIIGASWATASTPIIGDIAAIKKLALKNTGYPIQHAFYGASIIDDLLANTQVLALIGGSGELAGKIASGEIPNGFAGIPEWHPNNGAFFMDNDGTVQDIIGADTVVFTPEPDRTWWEIMEGSFPVPTNLTIAADASGALPNFSKAYGPFSYAEVKTDPPGIKHLAGHTFLPVLKVPKAVYICDVTP